MALNSFLYHQRAGAYRTDSPSESRQNSMLSSTSTHGGSGHTYPPTSSASEFNGNAPALRPPPRSGSSNNFFSPNGPLVYYPPLNQTWGRIKRVLAEHVPELSDSLNIPIDLQELQRIEAELGIMLPPSVRDSYLCVDGQDPSADFKEGIFFGLTLLPLEDVLREWSFWRRVEFDPSTGQNPDILAIMSSIPPGWVKPLYACRGWLPLIADKCGNYVGVDLDPPGNSHTANRADSVNGTSSKSRRATGGSWGQVILFGRDFDRKCVLWRGEGEGGWGRWLASFAEELESGAGWEISDRSGGSRSRGDRGSDTDEESEDDIGYSSYYFDAGGATGSSGQGLRLTGEYRGWGVMEAWWDRSVRKWEELGLGIQPEELKRQQEEIDKSNISAPDLMGLGFGGMRIGTAGEDAQVAIPGGYSRYSSSYYLLISVLIRIVLDDPNGVIPSVFVPQAPPTPTPETALLASRPPLMSRQSEAPSNTENLGSSGFGLGVNELPRRESSSFRDFSGGDQQGDMRIPSSPRQLTPHSPDGSDTATVTVQSPDAAEHHYSGPTLSLPFNTVSYSSADGLLSPHPQSPPARRPVKRAPAPAPAPQPLDLPTRADVQAAEAVASAEARGLRGGWVMSMEAMAGQHQYSTASASSSRRSTVSTLADDIGLISMPRDKGKKPMRGGDEDLVNGGSHSVVMENIDLERGRNERFGSQPGPSRSSVERTSVDGPHIGMDSRRPSQNGAGFSGGLQIRTPSPLSMMRANDATPRPTVSTRNSAFFSDNPFDPSGDDHEGTTPVASKSAHTSPAVPVKEVAIKIQADDDVEAGMQDIKI